MNLKEEKNKIDMYSEKVASVLDLIAEYQKIFDEFNNKYGKIVEDLKQDFKDFFESEGFTVICDNIGSSYYESQSILISQYKQLEFKLDVGDDGNTNISFWKSKPQNEHRYIHIDTSVKEYKVNIDMENKKSIRGIDEIYKIKRNIKDSKYTLEEINFIYDAIKNDKNNYLIKELSKLEDCYFIGIEKNQGNNIKDIEFKKIEDLIKKL